MKKYTLPVLSVLLIATMVCMLFTGRFNELTPAALYDLIRSLVLDCPLSPLQEKQFITLSYIRLPRILAAILVGAALAVSGTCYQSLFMNPLVSPGILGVLAGASFGAGIGIVLFDNSLIATQIFAFLFACCAVGFALFFSIFLRWRSLLILLLGGMISASLFTSLTAFMKFLADTQYPAAGSDLLADGIIRESGIRNRFMGRHSHDHTDSVSVPAGKNRQHSQYGR